MQKIVKTFNACGNEIKVTTGSFGFRADTALMVQQGETVVMVFLTVSPKNTGLDYFPLGVNYSEKFYAGGIISGSRFVKRERRPSDDAVIKGRIIDRSMRPLFPEGFKREVSIVINVMAYDGENDPSILGANAATMAVHLSSVPFEGPVSVVRIGMDAEGNLLVNPKNGDLANSPLKAVVSCTEKTITQLEIEGDQVPEDKIRDAMDLAFTEAQAWNKAMNDLKAELGKEKLPYEETKANLDIVAKLEEKYQKEIEEALFDDENRNNKLEEIHNRELEVNKAIENEEERLSEIDILNAFHYIEKKITRTCMLDGKRLSGRGLDEIREIEIEANFLPRVHGSAMFRRGQTQALSITTLGSTRLVQTNESFEGESEQRYMHHYVGPNYSYGDAGRYSFYPGNREIGHGALAEKALRPVLPSEEDFPYAIRVVSEILSQNGSTSMAATCGSCLSLMDAGVPIKTPVAGISIGLITKDSEQKEFQLLTDVQDVEDYYGDMDFKVTGTKNGVTAIQMDTKLKGVSPVILKDALNPAKKARDIILEKFKEVLDGPRKELGKYAPRVESIKINPEKIGGLIGPGGKVIKGILETVKNKADVDIKDDGTVLITSIDADSLQSVLDQINAIVQEPEVGKVYHGKVAKIMNFGAFVDVSASISGLVHVSEIKDGFVKDVNEHLKVGQEVDVKLVGIDNEGRLKLSMKAVGADKK